MGREVTRRHLLGRAGTAAAGTAAAGLAGVGVAGCWSHSPGSGMAGSTATGGGTVVDGYRRFVTRPDLNPPVLRVASRQAGSQARYYFMNAPYSGPGRGGAIIADARGDLVWMGPDAPGAHRIEFNVQSYRGEPVLTWFEGVETHGWGQGVAVIADSAYHRRHVIRAHSGPHDRSKLNVDHHEFNITADGHALVSAFRTYYDVDLRPVGGPSKGVLVAGVCQEIDIATGKLIFEWDSLQDGVPLDETRQPFHYKGQQFGIASNPYDYFHINSIAPTPDGDLLISSRNTWSVYKVRKLGTHDSKIVWRMNGKNSDFTMGPGTSYFWQHHVRPHPGGIVTVFDNGAAPPKEPRSRALVLHVDEDAMHVTLGHQYVRPGQPLLADAMGSAQLLPNGNMLAGWGTNPYFSEFTPDGTLITAGQMTNGNPSYRTFASPWTGHPAGPPDVAARHRAGGATVYASWNGATELASWAVLTGKSPSSLVKTDSARKRGFETAIEVRSSGPYFAVQAHDASGSMLARSATVRIR
ncbi:MAG TPA: arylsulfotransferase family protein [Streptosporangiaceae bacterium]|nr:arylsulfotransferase family protein [Streptosporangiaceae bacterium]